MDLATTLAIIFLLLNAATFCLFWWDKEAARDGNRRIPEARLLQLALFGGSLGALAAQRLLRHKTRKEPFRMLLIAILVLHAALVAGALVFRHDIHRLLAAG